MIWYPNQQALLDLTVTETDDGFEFSAPKGTKCAAWLGYYNSTEELRKKFNTEIVNAIISHIEELENGNS